MGTQIQIAQSSQDERVLTDVLLKKYSLLCVPWSFSSPAPKPEPLGQCEARQQVFFVEEFLQIVMKNIRPVVGDPGRYLVHPRTGLCIEWDRTARKGQGYLPGRYYFDGSDAVSDSAAALLKKVMSLITRTIKATYPLTSGNRFPIFVGPDLAKMIDSGEADLVYPDGTPMAVSTNVHLRSG